MSAATATAAGPSRVGLRRPFWRRRSAIPGFGLTLGVTLTVLSLIVLIPLSAVAIKAAGLGWNGFLDAGLSPRAIAAYRLSFGASLIAALINGLFGLITAWAMVRYEFPGKAIINAMVDLPFALPTAVAGIALASLYADNGWLGGAIAPVRDQDRLYRAGRRGRPDLHRPAVRGAHPGAGDQGPIRRCRGGLRQPGRQPIQNP